MTIFATPRTSQFASGQAEIDSALEDMAANGDPLTPGDDAQATVECVVDNQWVRVNRAIVEFAGWDLCPGSDTENVGEHPFSDNDFGTEVCGGVVYCVRCANEGVLRCCRECAWEDDRE